MNIKHFFLLLGIAFVMAFTISCGASSSDPYETDEFYLHGADSFLVINESEYDITSVVIRTWAGADYVLYNELISKNGGSKFFSIPNEILPPSPLMCVQAENRPKLDCIKFSRPSYTWDGKDLYITRLPNPLKLESL